MPDATLAADSLAATSPPGARRTSNEQPDLRARQRAVVLAFGRRPAVHTDASALMHDAIELIAETLHLPVHAIAELDRERGEIRLRASATRGLCEVEDAAHVYAADPAASLVGHALAAGQPVVAHDLAAEDRFRDAFLQQLGAAAGFAVPLTVGGQPYGALAALARDPQEFALEDIDFAESLAQLLAATLGRLAAEDAAARAQAALEQFWNTTDSLLLVADWSGRINKANAAAAHALGQTSAALCRQSLAALAFEPADAEATSRILRQATQTAATLRFQCAVRGDDGRARQVKWAVAALPNERGVAESILFDGTDITHETQLAQRVEQAQAALQATRAALAKMVATARGEPAPADAAAAPADAPRLEPRPFQAIESPEYDEQRDSQRRAFPYRQLVAPMRGDALPGAAEFQPLQFRDISASGVSFFAPAQPDYERVVIRLGSPPNVHFVLAQVVNATLTPHFGRTMYLVGCRFLERIAAPK